jgi:Ras family protein T1
MATVRICVCGDDGVGKTSIIASYVKGRFVPGKIKAVIPSVTLPPYPPLPPDAPAWQRFTTTVVDTSARQQDSEILRRELRKCNVILLVYQSDSSYSFERVALFWMPYFRQLGVNVPVVVCCNKSDLQPDGKPEEMEPIMNEFKEINECIRASAKESFNVVEAFWLCQRAVVHPIAPLFDYKTGQLKALCVAALRRIFLLSDKDQDGLLNDEEMTRLQERCFGKAMLPGGLDEIKAFIAKEVPGADYTQGINLDGFLRMNKIYVSHGRHETIWGILRRFRYSDSLSLEDKFLRPKIDVPDFASAELSPQGYKFFVDLFILFDQDNDGGLNDEELAALFRPTPGIPKLWADSEFPMTTVRNESGHITLQGWLAQWSMTTFLEPKTTLEYLAYLGYGDPDAKDPTSSAIKVTKPRKRRRRMARTERNVVHCYLVGAPMSGKSSLLDSFLNRTFSPIYNPTMTPRKAVNSVELPGGKQCYMILEELGHLEPAILENQAKLDACDLICFVYDSSDPESFAHIVELRERHPALNNLPAVYAALKADRDKTMQNTELQPDAYTAALSMSAPRHVSVAWDSISELFVALAEAATTPAQGFPKGDESGPDRASLYFAFGAVVCASAAAFAIWRRSTISP